MSVFSTFKLEQITRVKGNQQVANIIDDQDPKPYLQTPTWKYGYNQFKEKNKEDKNWNLTIAT